MPLKESHGNMYPWVTHMHTHLAGECQHRCSYCYVGRTLRGRPEKYSGEPGILEKEFAVNYGHSRIIFIEHMNDLWGPGVKDTWILRVLEHCGRFPDNTYVFQTKNPRRAYSFLMKFPDRAYLGTTIETNRTTSMLSQAPAPVERYLAMADFKKRNLERCFEHFKLFVTIEPIMDFDVQVLAGWLKEISPAFINIGADSKGCGLAEPGPWKLRDLINRIGGMGIEIRRKTNLARLFLALDFPDKLSNAISKRRVLPGGG